MALELSAGAQVKQYTLERLLGRGASGEVWKALAGEKTVAIKFMNPHLLTSKQAAKHRQRLEREIEVLSLLKHPNIPALFDHDLTFERPYLAMDFVGDATYDRLLMSGYMLQLPLRQRVGIIVRLADALEAAHAAGVIHRDIKPSNMIGVDVPFLLDFSISLTLEDAQNTSADIGTALYMDPDDRVPDASSDNFGFALVVYEMLFGVHAIFPLGDAARSAGQAFTRFQAGERIRKRQWRFPSKLYGAELPDDLRKADLIKLDGVFERAFSSRETRYQSLDDFVTDLKEALAPALDGMHIPPVGANVTPPPMPAVDLDDDRVQMTPRLMGSEPVVRIENPQKKYDPKRETSEQITVIEVEGRHTDLGDKPTPAAQVWLARLWHTRRALIVVVVVVVVALVVVVSALALGGVR